MTWDRQDSPVFLICSFVILAPPRLPSPPSKPTSEGMQCSGNTAFARMDDSVATVDDSVATVDERAAGDRHRLSRHSVSYWSGRTHRNRVKRAPQLRQHQRTLRSQIHLTWNLSRERANVGRWLPQRGHRIIRTALSLSGCCVRATRSLLFVRADCGGHGPPLIRKSP